MDVRRRTGDALPRPTFGEMFTPKLVTILREGYGLGDLRADVLAGLTVAIVALPLSMAIASASGRSSSRAPRAGCTAFWCGTACVRRGRASGAASRRARGEAARTEAA